MYNSNKPRLCRPWLYPDMNNHMILNDIQSEIIKDEPDLNILCSDMLKQ
jgi:hypothetical protein